MEQDKRSDTHSLGTSRGATLILRKEMILSLATCEIKKLHQLPVTARAGLTKPDPAPSTSSPGLVLWVHGPAVGAARAGLHTTEATTGCRALCKHTGVRTATTVEADLPSPGALLPPAKLQCSPLHRLNQTARPALPTPWGMDVPGNRAPHPQLPSFLFSLPPSMQIFGQPSPGSP